MIRSQVIEVSTDFCQKFQNALPFKYLSIDNFFDTEVAESLLRDFPSFDAEKAKNEFGYVGKKAVNTEIAKISKSYKELYEYLSSTRFLKEMSALTGIPDLLHDPKMYGGGTHENLHGQGLDTHVDFNYDQDYGLHRRVNFLLYLNKEWQEEWGGTIELHSNPRKPEEDKIIAINPIFNRAVIFETNEYSWHGFPQINLPEDKRHLSRKCISVYLYSKERPANEIVPPHGTFYVQRPLPDYIKPGLTLSDKDMELIKNAIKQRDNWIELYQKNELRDSAIIKHLTSRSDIMRFFYAVGKKILPKPIRAKIKKNILNNSGASNV